MSYMIAKCSAKVKDNINEELGMRNAESGVTAVKPECEATSSWGQAAAADWGWAGRAPSLMRNEELGIGVTRGQ